MVKEADAAYRLIAPTSQTNESRHEGSLREVRKIIKAGKPLIEHFFMMLVIVQIVQYQKKTMENKRQ